MNTSSYGQTLLALFLRRIIRETPLTCHRPEWAEGLELDLYFPTSRLAFEFQGGQHYVPVYGREQLRAQQYRDRVKRAFCIEQGVVLIRVDAADLYYGRLVRLLRCHFQMAKRKDLDHVADLGKQARNDCRQIGNRAKEYRASLIRLYNCPTARKKRSAVRSQVMGFGHR